MAKYRVTHTRFVTVEKLPPTAGKTFFKVLGVLLGLCVLAVIVAGINSH